MFSLKSQALLRIGSISLCILLSLIAVSAQEDLDPNSPTPILLSENDSTRALAQPVGKSRLASRASSRAFAPNQKIELFVTNIDLMEGEAANAFRIYIEDSKGHEYRFPVLEIRPAMESQRGVYSVITSLTDDAHYWNEPPAEGDVLVRLSWRGLSSNRVRLALGKTGGDIKDDTGAVPTPLSFAPAKSTVGDGPTEELVGYRWSGDRIRFLEQATFGPTQALDSRIRRI